MNDYRDSGWTAYQARLTQARREAVWRALVACKRDRERRQVPAQGKRPEQVVFSLVVLAGALLAGLLAGAAVAVWQAIATKGIL